MSKNLLHLTIVKIDGPVFDGDVLSVTVPGVAGELTLLAHHEAFISPLKAGTITIRRDDEEPQEFEVAMGMIEVSENTATVLI